MTILPVGGIDAMGEEGAHDYQQERMAELAGHQRRVYDREAQERHHRVALQFTYQMKLGRVTVKLDPIEFRILQFLSSQPYRAFTRKRIAKAVSTERNPVAAESLDHHITRLRDALGFFRDYIQTVPYIGYRFRA